MAGVVLQHSIKGAGPLRRGRANCTNVILMHARMNPGHPSYSWKILLSGYAPEYAYENGKLDTSLPFQELMRRSRVNDAAQPKRKCLSP